MSSKILEYADYVISNFNTTESEFAGAVNVSGDLKVVGTIETNEIEIDAQNSGYLKVVTGPNGSTDKYTFPSTAPSRSLNYDKDKRYYLSTVTGDSSGQLEWASFDDESLSIEFISEFGEGLSAAFDGGILYVDGFDGTMPKIAMDRANSFKMIENQDGLPGHLVDNEDELLITANRLSASKQLAKIKVADLIQSVQILATDIQVIGFQNNKVITSSTGVTVEVEDTDGNINRSIFNDNGLIVQGSLTTEELFFKTAQDTVSLIGSSYDTSPSSLGYSFVRAAHNLSMEYLNTQSISLFDDRLYIGSASTDNYIDFASNNYFQMNTDGAYIINEGSINVGPVGVTFSNTFSCSVDTILDQKLDTTAEDVTFENLVLSENGVLVGDPTQANPMVELKIVENVMLSTWEPKILSNQFLKIEGQGVQLGTDTEKLTIGDADSKLYYNGNKFDIPGIQHDGTSLLLKETLDGASQDITNVNELTVVNQINAAEIRGTGSGSCEFYDLIATNQANLKTAISEQIVATNSGGVGTIFLRGDSEELQVGGAPSTKIVLDGTTGVITNPSGTVTSSSISIKENVQSFTNGLEAVMNMKPVSYNRKKQPKENREIGFIAEEMEQSFPQVVRNNSSNNIKGISYQEIIPVLVSALQEQQKKIDQLESKISK